MTIKPLPSGLKGDQFEGQGPMVLRSMASRPFQKAVADLAVLQQPRSSKEKKLISLLRILHQLARIWRMKGHEEYEALGKRQCPCSANLSGPMSLPEAF